MKRKGVAQLIQDGTLWLASHEELESFSLPLSSSLPFSHGIPFGVPRLDGQLPLQGLPLGRIHEFLCDIPLEKGSSSTSSFLPLRVLLLLLRQSILLKEEKEGVRSWHKGKNSSINYIIAWVGKPIWPYGVWLAQALSLEKENFLNHCLFINPTDEKERFTAIETLLASPLTYFLVAYTPSLSFRLSRRLALIARKGRGIYFLIRPLSSLSYASAAYSRWSITPFPTTSDQYSYSLSLISSKGFFLSQREWIIQITENFQVKEISSYGSIRKRKSV